MDQTAEAVRASYTTPNISRESHLYTQSYIHTHLKGGKKKRGKRGEKILDLRVASSQNGEKEGEGKNQTHFQEGKQTRNGSFIGIITINNASPRSCRWAQLKKSAAFPEQKNPKLFLTAFPEIYGNEAVPGARQSREARVEGRGEGGGKKKAGKKWKRALM